MAIAARSISLLQKFLPRRNNISFVLLFHLIPAEIPPAAKRTVLPALLLIVLLLTTEAGILSGRTALQRKMAEKRGIIKRTQITSKLTAASPESHCLSLWQR